MRGKVKKLLLFFAALCCCFAASGQKVGLVLSGGGAKGMAHIGVIRAMEEQGIPIDYIAGTSIGAIVGGLYAAGYSTEEMEAIFSNKEFDDWVKGRIEDKYIYFFKQETPNSTWAQFEFDIASTKFEPVIPVNIISPTQMDFAFLNIFSPAEAHSAGCFDSLFVPFRCIATDITNNQEVVFRKGSLKDAVRASMTFPFYFRPISIDSSLMYDGGMINNFPFDVMMQDFKPDYIIAVAVAKTVADPNEENLISVLNSMLMNKQKYQLPDSINGILITPNVPSLNVTDFAKGRKLISVGYDTFMDSLSHIRRDVPRYVHHSVVEQKRMQFRCQLPEIYIDKIEATGIKKSRANIVENYLLKHEKLMDLEDFKERYFKLYNEVYVDNIYPTLIYDSLANHFDAKLDITLNKPFQVKFGGYVTISAHTTFYIQMRYNIWKRYFMNVTAEAYFGKFYNSGTISYNISSLTEKSFTQKISLRYERWNHFKTSKIFIESDHPSYLTNEEFTADYNICIPLGHKAKLDANFALFTSTGKYFSSNYYTQEDTMGVNRFWGLRPKIVYQYNTQDLIYFATKGSSIYACLEYFWGLEQNRPGSNANEYVNSAIGRNWFSFNLKAEHIFRFARYYSLGISTHFAWSNQPKFKNYTATKLRSNAFFPTHESNFLYSPSYRDPQFITFGFSNIFRIYKKLQLRVEGYYYQPFYAIERTSDNGVFLSKLCQTRSGIFYSSLTYNTKLGPVGMNISWYSAGDPKWVFNISFGYLFFNNRIF